MTVEKINPEGLHEPEGYTNVAVATGTKRVYIAGQVGVDVDDAVVGADLTSQTAQAFENVRIALAAAGAGWEHVAKLNIYVVDVDEAKMGEFGAGMGQAMEDGLTPTAATLIGVQALYRPDILVEIDAIAEV
jgi:enamine deaminase RidA (YjgF/YER057c/UK114 family)